MHEHKLYKQKLGNNGMKNTGFALFMIVILVAAGAIFFWPRGNSNDGGTTVISEDAQKITISMRNANYYPQTITVKEGQPVALTLDKSVGGCFRSFTVRDLGVSEYSASPNEPIIFTPAKKGTFKFACSMGMGYGNLIVE